MPGSPGRRRMMHSRRGPGELLKGDLAPVARLGIDEHCRGRDRFAVDERTGEHSLLADRWHTCFFDLDGRQGLLGQVEDRTADDAAYWQAGATPGLAGRGPGRVHRPVRHLRLSGAPQAWYGRRGRSGDPEYGTKGLLVRNLEYLSAAQFDKIIDTPDRDRYGQEIAAAVITGLTAAGSAPPAPADTGAGHAPRPQEDTLSNRAETRSRLTSKAR
jgi:hypothetical protein